jgi:transposase
MKKCRSYNPEQLFLLPPSLNDWVPAGHLSLFVGELVDALDLSEILRFYEEEERGGKPPYHPLLMVKLLVYGYCLGVRSSRQIERLTWENIPFRLLSADQHPDHNSISAFRKRHIKGLSNLFEQVLNMATRAGLVGLEHVCVDGTKVEANASRGKTLSYTTASKREESLRKSVEEWLEEANRVDEEEDQKYGDASPVELSGELATREGRLAKIRELKEKMDRERLEAKKVEEEKKAAKPPKKKYNKKPKDDEGKDKKAEKQSSPDDSFRRNLTDYDSRIMHLAGGNWSQSYNAQSVVDSTAQIVLACDVTNVGNDVHQFIPMMERTIKNTGKRPKYVSADAGYFADNNVKSKALSGIDILIMPTKPKIKTRKFQKGKYAFVVSDEMKLKLEQPLYKELYKKRKTIVEPVFGQIKEALKFRKFSFRGLQNVIHEWSFVCSIHNMMKLYRRDLALAT